MKEYIQKLSPDKLVPFQKHPYQVREDAARRKQILYCECDTESVSASIAF